MANRPCGRNRQTPTPAPVTQQSADLPSFKEPEMRRWPHPVEPVKQNSEFDRQANSAIHYIHCALSYQNQLLAEIKALLEQLLTDATSIQEGK